MVIESVVDPKTAAEFLTEQLGTTSDWWGLLLQWLAWQGVPNYWEHSGESLRYAVAAFVKEHCPEAVAVIYAPIVRDVEKELRKRFVVVQKPGAHPVTSREIWDAVAEGIRESVIRQRGNQAASSAVDFAGVVVATVSAAEAVKQMCETGAIAAKETGNPWRCVCGMHPEDSGEGFTVFPNSDGVPQAVLDKIRESVIRSEFPAL